MSIKEQNEALMGPAGEHEHVWGPVHMSPLAGNPHRDCTVPGCRFISLDLSDEDDFDE